MTSYPTTLILSRDGKEKYSGESSFRGLYAEFDRRLPDRVRLMDGGAALSKFLPRCQSKLCVLLFSTKKEASVLYKDLAATPDFSQVRVSPVLGSL